MRQRGSLRRLAGVGALRVFTRLLRHRLTITPTGLGVFLAVVGVLGVLGGSASAHSGGLNAQGCHINRKTGDYHCHRPQPPASPSSDSIKKSGSGICHAPGSTYYSRTLRFAPYPTLKACLDSGGRLPKR